MVLSYLLNGKSGWEYPERETPLRNCTMKPTTVPLAILFSLTLNGEPATEFQESVAQAIIVPLPIWVATPVASTAMEVDPAFLETTEECKAICPLPPEEFSASAPLVWVD
jgi:hypothetical protein